MNLRFLLLGVIIILVIYFVYTYFFRSTVIGDHVYLKDNNGTIGFDTLDSPGATRFSLSMWIYIENLNSSGNSNLINADPLSVFIASDASLKYSIDNGTSNNVVMSNFPLQRWVCLVLSFDNDVIDSYVDGKLIRSQQLSAIPSIGAPGKAITYGSGVEGYIAMFERLLYPMDPSTAWSRYMSGNGGITGGAGGANFSNYGARVILTKDGKDLSSTRMF